MRAVRIWASGAGKSRTVLLQKRTASRVKNFKKICLQIGHMIKYLLTKLGWAGWENISLSVVAHGPRCTQSVRHDLEPNIFPVRPSHLVNKYIILTSHAWSITLGQSMFLHWLLPKHLKIDKNKR